jgi:hypothetical protein
MESDAGMKTILHRKAVTLSFCLLLSAAGAFGQSTLVLKNAFIEKYKNRVTADATFAIDHAHARPNPVGKGAEDGDLHFSGRSDEIGLPLVAEIINAKLPSQKKAMDFVHQEEGSDTKVALKGVWRIWFEHPPAGHGTQVQGDPVPVPKNTNPDHVFEFHPVVQVGTNSVLPSFIAIPGYHAYDASTAFDSYESLTATIQANGTATEIESKKAGYNYAEFFIELEGPLSKVEDGFLVLANVVDEEGNPVVSEPRRMVFLAGTPAAAAVQKLKKGDTMHVMGIPRLNLERISFAMQTSGGASVTVPLPYEMIIIGAMQD